MCGIIGYFSLNESGKEEFLACRDRMYHRGPDDAGYWQDNNGRVLLGHRRLAIIDLSAKGHQPMVSGCDRYVITFNGEIYNYLELKKELEGKGISFNTESDTEVILESFKVWGTDCLSRFNGMFAFAIWDKGTALEPSRLFMARDRAGKKPFYYVKTPEAFAYASELKAIPQQLRGGVDLHALNYYLALGYIPDGLCFLEGVRKLPPAHYAIFTPSENTFHMERWWQLPPLSPVAGVTEDELCLETERLLSDSVSMRLRSDVPVGVLLSGGLDSSLVVASAAEKSPTRVQTFTMALPGSAMDESAHAALVAKHFDTDHHVLEITRPSIDVLDELAPLIDEPMADSSIIPTYLISKLTAKHVKVVLGGDGGDEIFAGYTDYMQAYRDNGRFGWLPETVFRMLGMAAHLPTGVRGRNRLGSLRRGPFEALIWGSPYFDPEARKRIISPDVVAELGNDFMAPERFLQHLFRTGKEPVDSMTRTHFGSILPDDFLVKVDRASMAASLEMRSPFLDYRLVEFAFSRIPGSMKVGREGGRLLERKLGRKLLPPDLPNQRKQGFSIPVDAWLRGELGAGRNMFPGNLSGLINEREFTRLCKSHQAGRANGSRLFNINMLGMAVANMTAH